MGTFVEFQTLELFVYQAITIPEVDPYQLVVEDFADALLNNRPPQFAPQDAIASMRVIDQMLASGGVK